VTGAGTMPAALRPAAGSRAFGAVLAGVALDGEAARLAVMIDSSFLAGAGWDPVSRAFCLPAGHRMLGRGSLAVTPLLIASAPGSAGAA